MAEDDATPDATGADTQEPTDASGAGEPTPTIDPAETDDVDEALRLPDGGSTRREGETTEDVGEGYPEGWEMNLSEVEELDEEQRTGSDRRLTTSDDNSNDDNTSDDNTSDENTSDEKDDNSGAGGDNSRS